MMTTTIYFIQCLYKKEIFSVSDDDNNTAAADDNIFFQYKKEFRLNVFFMSDISMKVKELGLIRVKQLQRIKYRYQS